MTTPAPAAFDLIDPSATAEEIAADLISTNPSNDTVDAAVKEIIRAVEAHLLDDTEARKAIVALLFNQGIHAQAVRGYGVPTRELDDIIGEVTVRVMGLMLDPEAFDFARAAKSSACSWFRTASRNAAQTKTRDFRRAEGRNGTPTDPTVLFGAEVTYEMDLDEADGVTAARNDLVEEFKAGRRSVRGFGLYRQGLDASLRMLGLTRGATRPLDAETRDYATAALLADGSLAHRSARAYAAVVYGTEPVECFADVDDRLLGMWEDLNQDEIERIIDAPVSYAQIFAISAVAPWARPGKKSVQHLRGTVAALVPGDSSWRSLSSALVGSYVDYEFAATSDYSGAARVDLNAISKGYTLSRAKFPDLLGRAAAFEGFPLGSTVEQVRANLARLAWETLDSVDIRRALVQEPASAA